MATLKLHPFQDSARASSLSVAISDYESGSTGNFLSLRHDFTRLRKWESCRVVVSAQGAITSVENEKHAVDSSKTINRTLEEPKGSRKDLSILPSKLNMHLFIRESKFLLCIGYLLDYGNCLISIFNSFRTWVINRIMALISVEVFFFLGVKLSFK